MKKVLVGAGVVPGLTNFSFARLTVGQTVQFHSHPSKFEVCLPFEPLSALCSLSFFFHNTHTRQHTTKVFYCQSGQGEFVILAKQEQEQQHQDENTTATESSSSNNNNSGSGREVVGLGPGTCVVVGPREGI